MKNIKLLPLLGLAVCALLSFTYLKDANQVKDGTYKAYIKKHTSRDLNEFSGIKSYKQPVDVTITDNTVKNISQFSRIRNHDRLLGMPLKIDDQGNAVTEISFFEQNIYNKRDPGPGILYTFKLIIKKEELVK